MPLPAARAWPRRVAARVLGAARALASWRRSVVREAHRAGRLGRFAGWIRVLTAEPPSLRPEEPLALLTDALERAAAPSGERHRRSARSVTEPPVAPAGGSATARAHALHPRAARLSPRPLGPASPRRAGGAGARVGVVTAADTGALGELAADRAIRRLVASLPAEARPELAASATGSEPRRDKPTPAFASDLAKAALATQWAAAVGGRTAPRALLSRLSEGADGAPATPPAREIEPRRRRAERPVSRTGDSGLSGGAAEDLIHDARPKAAVDPGESGSTGAARAPSLPPLVRAASRGGPEPLRALAAEIPAEGLEPRVEAAARLRLTSAEAVSHGDELAVLAGRVKRILDEEARRHGIDV